LKAHDFALHQKPHAVSRSAARAVIGAAAIEVVVPETIGAAAVRAGTVVVTQMMRADAGSDQYRTPSITRPFQNVRPQHRLPPLYSRSESGATPTSSVGSSASKRLSNAGSSLDPYLRSS